MKRKLLLLTFCTILLSVFLNAQTNPPPKAYGIVLFAEGDEMTIYRAKVLKSYSALSNNVLGMQLLPGDLVQTGPGTYLEIQLAPSQTIIKVAENTSFKLTGLAQTGGSTLDIVYGRIRARVDQTLGKPGFSIRGQTAIAGVRGTEFGYDVIATPGIGSEPSSQVYCYTGIVKVIPLQAEDTRDSASGAMVDNAALDGAKSYTLNPGQMLAVYDAADDSARALINTDAAQDTVVAAGKRTVVFSKGIKNNIKSFWKNHEIKSKIQDAGTIAIPNAEPVDGSLADTITPLPAIDPLQIMNPQQYALQKNNDKVAGIVMLSLGIAADIFGLVVYTWGTDLGMTSSRDAHNVGLVTMTSGVFLNIAGIIGYIAGMSK